MSRDLPGCLVSSAIVNRQFSWRPACERKAIIIGCVVLNVLRQLMANIHERKGFLNEDLTSIRGGRNVQSERVPLTRGSYLQRVEVSMLVDLRLA